MSEEITALRRAGLRAYSAELSPEYERVQKLLLGRLAAHGATVDQLAKQEINDRRNVAMLAAFTKLLPWVPLEKGQWQFRTRDPYKARALQSHVIWRQQVSGGDKLDPNRRSAPGHISYPWKEEEERRAQEASRTKFSYRPYVVLGASGRGRHTSWLLGCIGEDDFGSKTKVRKSYGKVFEMQPSLRSRGKLGDLAAMARSEYPSPDEARQLFDLDEHVYVINGESVGSTQAKYKYATHLPEPRRISDVELGQYDVDSYLQRIATAFGLEQQLDDLYVAHSTLELPR